MRAKVAAIVLAALLVACSENKPGETTAASPADTAASSLAGWNAVDACATLDKAKVAAAAGSAVKTAELSGVTEANGGLAALSTCIYTLENGASIGVLTREAPSGSKLADALASAKGPEAQAMGMTFEDLPGVGKAALWNAKMDSLQVFYDDRRYAAINMMYAPKDTDAKAVTVAVAKALAG